jgi:hypothetical protein
VPEVLWRRLETVHCACRSDASRKKLRINPDVCTRIDSHATSGELPSENLALGTVCVNLEHTVKRPINWEPDFIEFVPETAEDVGGVRH